MLCLGHAMPEPFIKARRAEARRAIGDKALIVYLNAVVERLGISDYLPCVPGCFEETPYEVVLTDRFGTGQIESAVQRLSEGRVGHDGGDILRRNGLHQNRWNANRLPFACRLGDASHELEELRRTHDCVGNRARLD